MSVLGALQCTPAYWRKFAHAFRTISVRGDGMSVEWRVPTAAVRKIQNSLSSGKKIVSAVVRMHAQAHAFVEI